MLEHNYEQNDFVLFPCILKQQQALSSYKLTKQQVINKTYLCLVKGYNLNQVATITGYSKRTLTYYLKVNWNKDDTKPEFTREEIWASVCLLITKDTNIKSLYKRLKAIYGELLANKLIRSIRYYYKKFTRAEPKIHLSLQEELPFYN